MAIANVSTSDSIQVWRVETDEQVGRLTSISPVANSISVNLANTVTLNVSSQLYVGNVTFSSIYVQNTYAQVAFSRKDENILRQSSSFSTSPWTNNAVSITKDAVSGPFVDSSADTLTGATGSSYAQQTFTAIPNERLTLSVYAKSGSGNSLFLELTDDDGTRHYNRFNLVTGQANLQLLNSAHAVMVPRSDGWYRCWIVANTSSGLTATTSARVIVDHDPENIHVFGAQVRQGNGVGQFVNTTTQSMYLMAANNLVRANTAIATASSYTSNAYIQANLLKKDTGGVMTANVTFTADVTGDKIYANTFVVKSGGRRFTTFPSLRFNFAKTQDAGWVNTDRSSNAEYIAANGTMTNAISTVPRINYDAVTGECMGLLTERSAVDQPYITVGINEQYNNEQGTVVMHMHTTNSISSVIANNSPAGPALTISDGGASTDWFRVLYDGKSGEERFEYDVTSNNVGGITAGHQSITTDGDHLIAFSYNVSANTFVAYVDGIVDEVRGAETVPQNLNHIYFGSDGPGQQLDFPQMHVKDFMYFPVAM